MLLHFVVAGHGNGRCIQKALYKMPLLYSHSKCIVSTTTGF